MRDFDKLLLPHWFDLLPWYEKISNLFFPCFSQYCVCYESSQAPDAAPFAIYYILHRIGDDGSVLAGSPAMANWEGMPTTITFSPIPTANGRLAITVTYRNDFVSPKVLEYQLLCSIESFSDEEYCSQSEAIIQQQPQIIADYIVQREPEPVVDHSQICTSRQSLLALSIVLILDFFSSSSSISSHSLHFLCPNPFSIAANSACTVGTCRFLVLSRAQHVDERHSSTVRHGWRTRQGSCDWFCAAFRQFIAAGVRHWKHAVAHHHLCSNGVRQSAWIGARSEQQHCCQLKQSRGFWKQCLHVVCSAVERVGGSIVSIAS
jgi:hypothetical protein